MMMFLMIVSLLTGFAVGLSYYLFKNESQPLWVVGKDGKRIEDQYGPIPTYAGYRKYYDVLCGKRANGIILTDLQKRFIEAFESIDNKASK
jgi:hypothetical protein